MNVLIILGLLFLALIIIIPLIEKSNVRMSDETSAKISRYIWPLMIIALVVSMLTMFL